MGLPALEITMKRVLDIVLSKSGTVVDGHIFEIAAQTARLLFMTGCGALGGTRTFAKAVLVGNLFIHHLKLADSRVPKEG